MMGDDGGGGGRKEGRKDEDPLLGLRKVGMVLRARARAAAHVLTARAHCGTRPSLLMISINLMKNFPSWFSTYFRQCEVPFDNGLYENII